ncbi:MAG TPA: 16S rRNA (adenine(1518)-N(6)/adenine(1519)-N(6))-dimethyltransferase RsmA [Bacillota bacterium]|nr:16S rRNA (adenine(1518)-N(6)/adenine(1519)-N(6))-dimethyltransferase RsmA [Bacillota bacterium]
MNLASPKTVRELLQRYGLEAKKGLGQNFLTDGNTLRRIVSAAEIGADDYVLEIGPGLGALTRELAQKAHQVVSVETDRTLTAVLAETLGEFSNIRLVYEDFMRVPLSDLIDAEHPWKVVANLPYYITTPILFRLLEGASNLERLVFLVQKEVAQRAASPPGNKVYGALSVALQHRCAVRIAGIVPPTVFMPPPKVESAILVLEPKPNRIDPEVQEIFEHVVEAAFRFRRKTLNNALTMGAPDLFDPDTLAGVRGELGIDLTKRGENLTVNDYETVASYLAARRRRL